MKDKQRSQKLIPKDMKDQVTCYLNFQQRSMSNHRKFKKKLIGKEIITKTSQLI